MEVNSVAPPPAIRSRRRGVLHHGGNASRAVRGHRHMVLLVGRGRDRIDAGRIGVLLVLGDQCCGGYLRVHESELRPDCGVRKAGRPESVANVVLPGRAPLAKADSNSFTTSGPDPLGSPMAILFPPGGSPRHLQHVPQEPYYLRTSEATEASIVHRISDEEMPCARNNDRAREEASAF
jgi:hypothetical protein